MINYRNINGNSNVFCYEIGSDFIDVQFNGTAKIYKYTYHSAGKENVETMKKLAVDGCGLNSFINRNVRNLYVK